MELRLSNPNYQAWRVPWEKVVIAGVFRDVMRDEQGEDEAIRQTGETVLRAQRQVAGC